MMYKIARERLPELYAAISAVKSLYLPVEDAGQCLFEKWTPESRVCLDCLNTVKSAKELLPEIQLFVLLIFLFFLIEGIADATFTQNRGLFILILLGLVLSPNK